MSRPEKTHRDGRNSGWYVYGIVPGDAEAKPDIPGVGDPAGPVEVVRHGDIAAMVSQVRTDRPLGRPEDLMAHEQLLDAAAAQVPVLPLRFGAVLTDKDAVGEELLAAHHDEFATALHELEGVAEYIVKGRYDESTVLSEVLADNPELGRMRQEIQEQPEEATRQVRIRLGEMINSAILAKRGQDTQAVLDALGRHARSHAARDPAHELDAVHLALLVETERQPDLERAVSELAERSQGRIEFRLLGPLAAYDFVTTAQPAG